MLGVVLKKRFRLGIFNPLLISIAVSIVVLLVGKIDYEVYNDSAKYLGYLLTPATVCLAIPLYEQFCAALSAALGKPVPTGTFGADMQVALVNDGPVTICIDTKNKE
jgi:putative effector of murein hydrolase